MKNSEIAYLLGKGMAMEGMIGVFEYCKQFPWNDKNSIDRDIQEIRDEMKEIWTQNI